MCIFKTHVRGVRALVANAQSLADPFLCGAEQIALLNLHPSGVWLFPFGTDILVFG